MLDSEILEKDMDFMFCVQPLSLQSNSIYINVGLQLTDTRWAHTSILVACN